MTPLLAQTIAAVVVLVTLIVLLLMGYRLWLQCQAVAEQDRQREAQRLATFQARRKPPPGPSAPPRKPPVRRFEALSRPGK